MIQKDFRRTKYKNADFIEYREVKNEILRCLPYEHVSLSVAYLDEDNEKDCIVYRHKILCGTTQVGTLIRYVNWTRHDIHLPAEFSTRCVFDTELCNSIVEFDIEHDRLSNEETLVKLARLKELIEQQIIENSIQRM